MQNVDDQSHSVRHPGRSEAKTRERGAIEGLLAHRSRLALTLGLDDDGELDIW
ncbi:hypothetical protein [uncultured Roseibium sp.]|uniref:hypothetical protein n=1 Tax=uncultured Roseibium sp. TaxID=1936171 RepID=UPI00262D1A06|nr:hypothetical protein [uncultured Roseibium sp.]